MQSEELIRFWGANNLKRWSEADLRDALIPASSKSFLMEVGLPFRENWTLRFNSQATILPRLTKRQSCRRIGFDDAVPICLDEEQNGRVIAVEDEASGSERLINSNVERFAECLVYYKQYRATVRLASQEEVQKIIDTAESQIRRADPAAFEDADNWWRLIIEQMNHGLL